MTNVSWDLANEYCKWAGGRLPTEAEREYAAAAGRTGIDPNAPDKCDDSKRALFYWGNDYSKITGNLLDVAHTKTTLIKQRSMTKRGEYDDKFPELAPVGSFDPNPFKLFDMEGNVSEWCSDFYSSSYYKRSRPVDPKGPPEVPQFDKPDRRVFRGANWSLDVPWMLRTTQRRAAYPESTDKTAPSRGSMILGFRVVFDYLPTQ